MKFTKYILIGSLTLSYADEPVYVYGSNDDPIDSQVRAEEAAKSTPGGASVISAEESIAGTGYNTQEILTFTPGVYAKAGSVQLDARLAVRGGGATRRFGTRGTTLLIDGVPANIADGSYYSRGYDGSNIDFIEVYRGANGLAFGGQSLGGTINFAQKNGKTDPGLTVFAEGGSFDLLRVGASYGYSEGKLDAFINVSRGQSDGFRDFQGFEQNFTNVNLGYEWNDRVSTRIYYTNVDSDVDLGSTLSFAQFEEDPTFTENTEQTDRNIHLNRIAQKTSLSFGDTEGLFYSFYQRTDLDHLTTIQTFLGRPNLIDFDSDDFGLGFRSTTEFDSFILRTDSSWTYGELANQGINGFGGGFGGTGQEDTEDTASNIKVYGELEYQFNDQLSFFTGLGFQSAFRDREVGADDEAGNIDFSETYNEFLPRVGIIYSPNENLSLYANYSRNFEAPASVEANTAAQENLVAIPSVADSFEIGSRYDSDRVKGELSVYYSIVNDEFLNEVNTNIPSSTINADAVYSGVELAGSIALLGDGFGSTGLFLDINYLYNNFFFTSGNDGGVDLDGNTVPGLPEHALNARLKYQHENGHELALTLETSSELYYDYENSESDLNPLAPSYAIFHLTGKYQVTEYLSLYGGVRNLFDEEFINSVIVEGGVDFSTGEFSGYSPGDGINYFVGAKLTF